MPAGEYPALRGAVHHKLTKIEYEPSRSNRLWKKSAFWKNGHETRSQQKANLIKSVGYEGRNETNWA